MKWTDDDLDLALRELKDEPLPPGAEEAVRARVLSEIEKPRRKWWTWAWAPALAAGVVLWIVIPREQAPVPPPPVLAHAPQAPVFSLPLERVQSRRGTDGLRQPQSRRVIGLAAEASAKAAGLPAPARQARPPETQFVKLVTDDPDVVILWAMNSEGDAQ